MLSEQEVQHFETFGFIVLRQVFGDGELATIADEYERGLNAANEGRPFDGSERHWAPLLGPQTPFFAALPEDPRFYQVAEQLYGEDVFGMTSDANRYVGDTRWHPDHGVDPSKDCYGIKFAYYLDAVDGDSGALRVLPGSHRDPYHTEIKALWEECQPEVAALPAHGYSLVPSCR